MFGECKSLQIGCWVRNLLRLILKIKFEVQKSKTLETIETEEATSSFT